MSIEFDVHAFCKRHLQVKSWSDFKQQNYKISELYALIDTVIELFKKEATLAQISPPVTIVGDIHGQFIDLLRLLNSRSSKNDVTGKRTYGFASNKWVFLGDYVDRGPHSIESICLVFSLKILFPNQYVLLRGNHETRPINFAYGFRAELLKRLSPPKEAHNVWEKFNEAFSWMPLACLVGRKILCMHGGIGPNLQTLNDILAIQRPLVDTNADRIAQDLLWADPADGDLALGETPQYLKNENRGLSVVFNKAAVHDVCRKLNISLIVRAHQMMPSGFRFYADRKLCTIFSAPRYMNETNNAGAVMKITRNGKISVSMMKKSPISGDSKPDEITEGIDLPSKSASCSVDN